MNHWLVKSEPDEYSWEDLNKEGKGVWTGVRNYTARNNLQAMKIGDLVFYYHSNQGKNIVGIAKVVKEAYQDPTTEDERWVVVDIAPVKPLKNPVSLEQIKAEKSLQDMKLVKLSRLSVGPVTKEEWEKIIEMSKK